MLVEQGKNLGDRVYDVEICSILLRSAAKWLRWSRGSVLAFSTQVRGFAAEAVGFLRANKSSARLPSEGK